MASWMINPSMMWVRTFGLVFLCDFSRFVLGWFSFSAPDLTRGVAASSKGFARSSVLTFNSVNVLLTEVGRTAATDLTHGETASSLSLAFGTAVFSAASSGAAAASSRDSTPAAAAADLSSAFPGSSSLQLTCGLDCAVTVATGVQEAPGWGRAMDWVGARATAAAEDATAAALGFATGVALVEAGLFALDFGGGAAPEDLEPDAAVWEWVEEELLAWV